MQRSIVPSVLVLAFSAIGCGPPPRPTTVVARPRGEEVGFPIYSMHLVPMPGAHGPNSRVDVELRPDGEIVWHGESAGHVEGRRVVDARGREVLSVDATGNVAVPRVHRRLQIQEDGGLLMNEGDKVYLDEQGRVVVDRTGSPPRWLNLQLNGWRPNALRTGALLVVYSMIKTHQL